MSSQAPSSSRRAARFFAAVVAWSLTIPLLLASGAWIISGSSFRIDLLANLGAQILILCIAVAVIDAMLRRWRACTFALLACAIQITPLVRWRGAYAPVPLAATPATDTVRMLHYNDSSLSDKTEVYALIERAHADIVSILSPPVKMQFDVIYGNGLEDAFAGKLLRPWKAAPDAVSTEISPGFVVSRWPLTPVDCSFAGPMSDRFICGIVNRPAGKFAIIAVHPRSPRSNLRWLEGNRVIAALITLSNKLERDGFPVVVLADLNSSPTGWRSRATCQETGLRRAKPLFYLDGTYPDVVPINIRTGQVSSMGAPWPLSIAIDDALISSGVEVAGWEAWDRLKSEHRPVIVDLRIPPPGTSGANPADR